MYTLLFVTILAAASPAKSAKSAATAAPAPSATATARALSTADISPDDLTSRKGADAPLVLDVRTPEEFAAGHVPGAWNVPVDEVRERAAEIRAKADGREIAVYCHSGGRAHRAQSALQKAGVPGVRHLEGDYSGWSAANRPVEK